MGRCFLRSCGRRFICLGKVTSRLSESRLSRMLVFILCMEFSQLLAEEVLLFRFGWCCKFQQIMTTLSSLLILQGNDKFLCIHLPSCLPLVLASLFPLTSFLFIGSHCSRTILLLLISCVLPIQHGISLFHSTTHHLPKNQK